MEEFTLARETKIDPVMEKFRRQALDDLRSQYEAIIAGSPNPLGVLEGIATDIIVTPAGMTVGKWIWQPRTLPTTDELIKK